MTEAQRAHFKESQMSLGEFVGSMDYEGLTPAQRQFGDEDLDWVYGRRVAPEPRDVTYYDTQERNGRLRFLASFNPEDSDWYPEVEEPMQAEVAEQQQVVATAVLQLVSEAA